MAEENETTLGLTRTEWGNVGLGLSVGASIGNAFAARYAGTAAQNQAKLNAMIGRMKAEDALARGQVDVNNLRIASRRLIGSQRAAFAASGVDITDADSTAANVFSDTARSTELDAQTIMMNATREAFGFQSGARDSLLKGSLAKAEADNRAIGGLFSTAGNVLLTRYGFR